MTLIQRVFIKPSWRPTRMKHAPNRIREKLKSNFVVNKFVRWDLLQCTLMRARWVE